MKDKIVYLEFLRIFCAIVVILDHICIAGIHIWGTHASTFDQFFYNGVQHWSHFAVPVFLMISGYLLLASQRKIDYNKVCLENSCCSLDCRYGLCLDGNLFQNKEFCTE